MRMGTGSSFSVFRLRNLKSINVFLVNDVIRKLKIQMKFYANLIAFLWVNTGKESKREWMTTRGGVDVACHCFGEMGALKSSPLTSSSACLS